MSSLWSALPDFGSLPTSVWAVIILFALPPAIIFGALAVKLTWGFWPLPIGVAASAYAIYLLGAEWFFLIAVGIGFGVVGTWLWQRSRLFLWGDRKLERGMFLGD